MPHGHVMIRTASRKVLFLALSVLALGSLGVRGARADDEDRNPYMVVYYNNWQIAELEVQEEQVNLANEEVNLARYEQLWESRAISRQQLEEQRLKTDTIRFNVDTLEAKAAEKRQLYIVNRARVDNGLEVPICPEGT